MRYLPLLLAAILFAAGLGCSKKSIVPSPQRVILFISDGLPVGAPERVPLPVFLDLKKRGCYYPSVQVIPAAHPGRVDSAEDPHYYPWGCSLPNPVAMTGTVFIGQPGIKQAMIQHSLTDLTSAFVVNCGAYEEISPGFDIYHQLETNGWPDLFRDELPVHKGKEVILSHDPAFVRIHLQGPGSAGHIVAHGTETPHQGHLKYADPDGSLPWFENIWHPKSPYVLQALYADSLLGDFAGWLESEGLMDGTVMMVMGDHGQVDEGTHPPYRAASNRTPLLIFGQGIKQGAEFDYAEVIDVAPTIARLLDVSPPRYATGRVLSECFQGQPGRSSDEKLLQRLSEVLIAHHRLLMSRPQLESEALNTEFSTLETIGRWHHRHDNLRAVVENNEAVLQRLRDKAQE